MRIALQSQPATHPLCQPASQQIEKFWKIDQHTGALSAPRPAHRSQSSANGKTISECRIIQLKLNEWNYSRFASFQTKCTFHILHFRQMRIGQTLKRNATISRRCGVLEMNARAHQRHTSGWLWVVSGVRPAGAMQFQMQLHLQSEKPIWFETPIDTMDGREQHSRRATIAQFYPWRPRRNVERQSSNVYFCRSRKNADRVELVWHLTTFRT